MRGISRETGATARHIRHWERLGLLGPVERTPSGWRVYEGAQFGLVWDINALRQQGFSIEEIRALTSGVASAGDLEALAREEELAAREAVRRARRLRTAATKRRRPAV